LAREELGVTVVDVETILGELAALEHEGVAAMSQAANKQDLDEARIKYLGKKSRATEIMSGLGQLSPQDKPRIGQRGNEVKKKIEQAHDER
jgi:phenylalanyl-tRNA synthetase alpha chain